MIRFPTVRRFMSFASKTLPSPMEPKENNYLRIIVRNAMEANIRRAQEAAYAERNPAVVQFSQIVEETKNLKDEKHKDLVGKTLTSYPRPAIADVLLMLEALVKCISRPRDLFHSIKAIDVYLRNQLTEKKHLSASDIILGCAVANTLFDLRFKGVYPFTSIFVQQLQRQIDEMDKPTLLNFLFLVTLTRSSLRRQLSQQIERKALKYDLNLKEAAVLGAAFFKTKMVLKNPDLIEYLTVTAAKAKDENDAIALSSILKVLRSAQFFASRASLEALTTNCVKNEAVLNVKNCNNLCMLTAHSHHYIPSVLDASVSKLLANLKEARLKDIERIVYSLSFFNHKCLDPAMVERICEEVLQKDLESVSNPYTAISLAGHLVALGFYPKAFIEKCCDPSFVGKVFSCERDCGLALLTLNTALTIEKFDEFNHCLLSEKHVQRAKSRMAPPFSFDDVNTFRKSSEEVRKTPKLLLNCMYKVKEITSDHLMFKHTLPFCHYPDILICKSPIDVALSVEDLVENTISDVTCLVVHSKRCFADRRCTILKGSEQMKLRLLRKLGYTVTSISSNEMNQQYILNERIRMHS